MQAKGNRIGNRISNENTNNDQVQKELINRRIEGMFIEVCFGQFFFERLKARSNFLDTGKFLG